MPEFLPCSPRHLGSLCMPECPFPHQPRPAQDAWVSYCPDACIPASLGTWILCPQSPRFLFCSRHLGLISKWVLVGWSQEVLLGWEPRCLSSLPALGLRHLGPSCSLLSLHHRPWPGLHCLPTGCGADASGTTLGCAVLHHAAHAGPGQSGVPGCLGSLLGGEGTGMGTGGSRHLGFLEWGLGAWTPGYLGGLGPGHPGSLHWGLAAWTSGFTRVSTQMPGFPGLGTLGHLSSLGWRPRYLGSQEVGA